MFTNFSVKNEFMIYIKHNYVGLQLLKLHNLEICMIARSSLNKLLVTRHQTTHLAATFLPFGGAKGCR